jgi:hypothetical protein
MDVVEVPAALGGTWHSFFSVQSFMSNMQWLTFANIVPEWEQCVGPGPPVLEGWLELHPHRPQNGAEGVMACSN